MSTLAWSPLTETDLPALVSLARACLAADGGLPTLGDEPMLHRFFLSDPGIGGRDETGDLVAVAGVFLDGTGRRAATGLVHPSSRNQGHSHELVAWCREHSRGSLLRVVAETTSAGSEALAAEIGLRRTFAEHVMRHDLIGIPIIRSPEGVTRMPFGAGNAGLFHTAYSRSFADRPGFPGTQQEEWLGFLVEDEDFLAEDSRIMLDEAGEPVAFVTLSDCWIDQVGVVPRWRGRRLGAHLVARSLSALAKRGCEQAWLAVKVDNPAHDLYLRLGFVDDGLRARYEETLH
ncbi:MAG: GNAT family N-acetyltransferase [Ornithinibacter sp.]